VDKLRIAGASINQTPLDWDGNRDRIQALLSRAKAEGVDVLCFPELSISGYGCEDMFFSTHTARMSEAVLVELLPETTGITVVLGCVVYNLGAMYNSAVMVQDGKILGVNPKKMLAREGIHYEPRWFKAWPFARVHTVTLGQQEVPFGDINYRLGSLTCAIEICEEAWGASPAAREHADHGAELVLNPSASHFALGKAKVRETLVADNSRAMQVHYVYTNLLGCEAGRIIYDGGVLIAECGTITARGTRFGFGDGELTIRDVALDRPRVAKVRTRSEGSPGFESSFPPHSVRGQDPRQRGAPPKVIAPLATPDRISHRATPGQWSLSLEEEFLEAEMLGLFDYLRKTKMRGFVVSLSGGCDSAAVALLCAQAIACALEELGSDNFHKRLGLGLPSDRLPGEWIHKLLTVVYQATANSGSVTRDAAKGLAQALNASFHEVNVGPIVEAYVNLGQDVLGRALDWAGDDLTLQNIQARTRAPLVWLVANAKGALLLATSNRSEAAVGYATMDGDTAGGLAPLGGIDKHFLRSWLLWAEKTMSAGLGPIAALRAVNEQAPTAELRPQGEHQTDEADLMPYRVLARIEQLFVRERMAPADILTLLHEEFRDPTDAAILDQSLDRFLRLWSQNQWKRERLAPAFHIEDPSLDPKTFCRYPILSGGFARERAELRPRP